MKKQLFFMSLPIMIGMLFTFCFTGSVNGQSSTPNGNFESWDSAVFQSPMYYPYNADEQAYFKNDYSGTANVAQVTPGYNGSTYAVQITTTSAGGDTTGGFFININPNNGNPGTWTGGMYYNQQATGLTGYYKCAIMPGDSALVIVAFSKGGNNIGSYFMGIGGSEGSWTQFNMTFNPPLSTAPDSVVIGFTSSYLLANTNGIPGSTITLSNISFTGVSSQPTDLNGNFALWQSQTFFEVADWYNGNNGQGDGLNRTTDAESGKYAIELTTYLGNNNNQPTAQSGQISTGYYPNNCDSMCNQMGGYPFANQVDTLAFYYKYAPQGNDSAVVELNFKKNASQFWGSAIFLPTASSYTYMDFPFDVGQTPDSVLISVQSSNWNDTAISYVGSDLKIDNIYFKSQLALGIKEAINNSKIIFYPNPFQTSATLEIDAQTDLQDMQLRMYDVFGRMVKAMSVTDYRTTLGKDNLSAGVYFYEVINNNGILKTGKIIIE